MSGDKRKRKARLISHDTAVAIDECRTYFELEASEKQRRLLTQPVARTAACFGISARTVVSIRQRLERGDSFNDGDPREHDMEAPEEFIGVVREAISDMYVSKERVTLDTLLKKPATTATADGTQWTWSRATLHRFLINKMHYSYGDRRSHYQDLKEDVIIANQRIAYARQVRRYRAEGRAIFYQDETWANRNMTPAKVWLDPEGKGGLKVPAGKGERSIICHAGGATGFVAGAKLIFRGKKSLKDLDYHTEMNADVFLDWLERKVFSALPSGSVLVIDRASYHTTLTEESKPAASKFTKRQFAQWLVDHGVESNGTSTIDEFMGLTRIELAALCKENKPVPVYRASVLARPWNCDVPLLPVAHPELNPIEMVWAYVKGHTARNSVDFSLVEVE